MQGLNVSDAGLKILEWLYENPVLRLDWEDREAFGAFQEIWKSHEGRWLQGDVMKVHMTMEMHRRQPGWDTPEMDAKIHTWYETFAQACTSSRVLEVELVMPTTA